jgi:hypothetical protein
LDFLGPGQAPGEKPGLTSWTPARLTGSVQPDLLRPFIGMPTPIYIAAVESILAG